MNNNGMIEKSFANNLPYSLAKTVRRISTKHYGELYEPNANDQDILEDDLKTILVAFEENSELFHLHYVWMTLILAIATQPTIKYYQPKNKISELVISHLKAFMRNSTSSANNTLKRFDGEFDYIKYIDPNSQQIISLQVLSEASDVYKNAINVLEPEQSLLALLNILDDCLEGYAIFPGTDGRRQLFDWWLQDVVRASWSFSLPSDEYLLSLLTKDNHPNFMQLQQLSCEIQASSPEFSLSKKIALNI